MLEKMEYEEHNWTICGDLEDIGLPLGLQCNYIYFLYI